MKLIVRKGRTSFLAKLFVQDTTKNDGSGLTGLLFNSSGLVAYRARDDDGNAAGTAITLATATRGTWASGGFVEKDATNLPGVYEFGIPDAALATGSETCVIMLKGAANMAPCILEIQLVNYDPQDSVRQGMTALPNVAAGASGGVMTVGNLRFQKNVGYSNFVFRMTQNGDHVSPATGLTIISQVSINGAVFVGTTNSATEIGSGWYKINLSAADLNGDSVALKFTATGADQLDMAIYPQVE